MKRFHRRCRRLCILAALLVLLVLFLRQNVLLDTASRHAILLDAQSGRVLAQKRADERTAPASLTKMMTALLVIEAEPDLDKQVTLPEDIFPALQTEKASMAGFVPGETVTVRDLLYGAMLPSGAECCEALARLVSGSEESFAALMNQKAAELGIYGYNFISINDMIKQRSDTFLQNSMIMIIIGAIILVLCLLSLIETMLTYVRKNISELLIHVICGATINDIILRVGAGAFFAVFLSGVIMAVILHTLTATIAIIITGMIAIIVSLIPVVTTLKKKSLIIAVKEEKL